MTETIDADLLAAMRELKGESRLWRQFVIEHPELASEIEKPKAKRGGTPKPDAGMKPGRSWEDRKRQMRSRGRQPEGAAIPGGQGDTAWQVESRSLVQLHLETGGAYVIDNRTGSNPDQYESCRECNQPLDVERLRRDDAGQALRGRGGQYQYCSTRCYRNRRNRKARNRTARKRGTRVLATYSAAHGVPAAQTSTGPQDRFASGEVRPWTVPFWAADPWLKFAARGKVPIGSGRTLDHSDPTGDLATKFADDPDQRSYPDPMDGVFPRVTLNAASSPIGPLALVVYRDRRWEYIPHSELGIDGPKYVHNIFDAVFDGMAGNYRELVAAGKPACVAHHIDFEQKAA